MSYNHMVLFMVKIQKLTKVVLLINQLKCSVLQVQDINFVFV